MERAVIQSSADIRTAESEASISFARVVLPAPGSPQMMNSVAWQSMGRIPPRKEYCHALAGFAGCGVARISAASTSNERSSCSLKYSRTSLGELDQSERMAAMPSAEVPIRDTQEENSVANRHLCSMRASNEAAWKNESHSDSV